MASLPAPPSGLLDRPPPSPANPPTPETPPGGYGGTGVQGAALPSPEDPMKQFAAMGLEIDRAIVALSEMAPGQVPEFGQARKLLQAGLAKLLTSGGGEAAAPGGTGSQFPGGGMVSGSPF